MACVPCWGECRVAVLPLVGGRVTCGEDAVGDGGGFDGGADVVGAHDVSAGEDGGYISGGCGLEAVFH